MSKKLMLLAAGVLSALAFAALPALASAGEFEAHCTNGAASCEGNVTGGTAVLTTDSGSAAERVHCTGVAGTATQTSTSSTGTLQLTFTGCKDGVISTQCNNTGTSGQIKTNVLTSHLIYIDPNKTTPGVLLTGVNTTFECPVVGVKKTVTGNIIGHWTDPQCGVAAASHTANFEVLAGDVQQFRQVTTAGPIFDLTSGSHASDQTTSVEKAEGTVNIPGTFTC